MSSDRLLERSAIEFERGIERYAEMLFANRVSENQNAFDACLREHPEGYMRLLDLAERAMRARNWFARHAACRFQPLTLTFYDDQEDALCSGDLNRHVVVYYSYSLRGQGFDYLKHPGFYEYGRGLLADPDCPIDLRDDQELLADFPPKPLPGLAGIYWSPVLPPEPWGARARPGHAKSL
jgi:hypothetical protein